MIIPCYNEEENLDRVVERLHAAAPDVDYLIVNDCSTDGSAALCRARGYNYISLPVNLGIGGGVQSGYLYAREHGYDVTVQMDGDGQHNPLFLADVVRPVAEGRLDMCIGSRFITKEGFQTSFMRRLGINFITVSYTHRGGTGAFVNTVLKHFLSTDIGEIRIFSRDEKKQDDMRHDYQLKYPELSGKIKFYIGDVRNPDSLRGVMRGVDYIFHAAALKQVPSCEFFPMEAVRTNVLGTDNVLTAAIDAGVKKVVCLSTDKAAYPINAMGISKAMMEKVIGAKARTVKAEATTICCTCLLYTSRCV